MTCCYQRLMSQFASWFLIDRFWLQRPYSFQQSSSLATTTKELRHNTLSRTEVVGVTTSLFMVEDATELRFVDVIEIINTNNLIQKLRYVNTEMHSLVPKSIWKILCNMNTDNFHKNCF